MYALYKRFDDIDEKLQLCVTYMNLKYDDVAHLGFMGRVWHYIAK